MAPRPTSKPGSSTGRPAGTRARTAGDVAEEPVLPPPTTNGGSAENPKPATPDGDPSPFPFLVGNVDLTEGTAPRSRSGGTDGWGGGQSAGATVSAAIRDILGYQTRTTDTKGFIAALQRSFTCVERPGYTHCEWTPRSYAATIPADLGALTGAQASIFERAKSSADDILPLLSGLEPLSSTSDNEDTASIKAIVRSRITEIVAELSLEGGPRTQRVDELFERLTGYPVSRTAIVFDAYGLKDGHELKGELRKLRDRLGMDRRNVNTLAEEENFTNFLIIVDSVATLFAIWRQTRKFFVRNYDDDPESAPFLGTQLVLISRQLSVIAETVQECYFAMDSVFLGAAERQTVLLKPTRESAAEDDPILLSELLEWIDDFCTVEGPQLIEEAGTDGVNAFVPTVHRLEQLAHLAVDQDPCNLQIPRSFFTRRVQVALAQLHSQLLRARDLADAVYERLCLTDPASGAHITEREVLQ